MARPNPSSMTKLGSIPLIARHILSGASRGQLTVAAHNDPAHSHLAAPASVIAAERRLHLNASRSQLHDNTATGHASTQRATDVASHAHVHVAAVQEGITAANPPAHVLPAQPFPIFSRSISTARSALVEYRSDRLRPFETVRAYHRAAGGSRSDLLLAAGASVSLVAAFSSVATVAAAKERPEVPLQLGGDKEVVLYQYEACPFCNKVKAFLDYYDIPYRVVEVNPIGKKELQWSEYKKVPVLVVGGEALVDSSAILSELQQRLNPSKAPIKQYPPVAKAAADDGSSPTATSTSTTSSSSSSSSSSATVSDAAESDGDLDEETKWRRWVDKHLVHLLSPNIYRTPGEALEAFDYIATNGNFSAWERTMARYVGATTMYLIGKRLKKKHCIEDERRSLYQAVDEWVEALGDRKFLGGTSPNLADLAVFGVLRPIRHLSTGKDMIANSRIAPWYQRMEEAVGASSRISTRVSS